MKTVAIVGYSNSGKSTVARALVAEARRRGQRAAAIKVGHHGFATAAGAVADTPDAAGTHATAAGKHRLRDTESLAAAGADPVVFRAPDGWRLQLGEPLEPRTQPLRIPEWLAAALDGVDLLVVEGRRVQGAVAVQTVGADGQLKYAPEQCHLVLRDVPQIPLPPELLKLIWD